jgi:hypothetical protein
MDNVTSGEEETLSSTKIKVKPLYVFYKISELINLLPVPHTQGWWVEINTLCNNMTHILSKGTAQKYWKLQYASQLD